MYINGCGCLCFFKSSMKNGLDEAKTVLWTSICWPSSQARVTSAKSLSSRNSLKAIVIFSLKSFHWRQSFSEEFIMQKDTQRQYRGQGCMNLICLKMNRIVVLLSSPKLNNFFAYGLKIINSVIQTIWRRDPRFIDHYAKYFAQGNVLKISLKTSSIHCGVTFVEKTLPVLPFMQQTHVDMMYWFIYFWLDH